MYAGLVKDVLRPYPLDSSLNISQKMMRTGKGFFFHKVTSVTAS